MAAERTCILLLAVVLALLTSSTHTVQGRNEDVVQHRNYHGG